MKRLSFKGDVKKKKRKREKVANSDSEPDIPQDANGMFDFYSSRVET